MKGRIQGFRNRDPQTDVGYFQNTDGALKCAATKADATANQTQRLPGSIKLNRPLQGQNQKRWTGAIFPNAGSAAWLEAVTS
jgi:hypothetical protein